MEKITVRKGNESDLPRVLELVKELALFEKAPDEVTNDVDAMKKAFSGDDPVFRLLVAETGSGIIGIAIYFIKYSTWKGIGVYLDDIVVTEDKRGKGAGTMLFEAVLRESRQIGAKQMHWQVLDWNKPAMDFYEKYGCSFDSGWVDCKLSEEQINKFR